ncbi:MAG: DUF2970 domain-containing protein [Pseudomonadales bacterium]|jgi:hypothetical protein
MPEEKPLSFREMLQSTLWAALGVQRHKNYERDFSRGHWLHFVIAGLLFSTFFVCLLLGIVYLAMASLD